MPQCERTEDYLKRTREVTKPPSKFLSNVFSRTAEYFFVRVITAACRNNRGPLPCPILIRRNDRPLLARRLTVPAPRAHLILSHQHHLARERSRPRRQTVEVDSRSHGIPALVAAVPHDPAVAVPDHVVDEGHHPSALHETRERLGGLLKYYHRQAA